MENEDFESVKITQSFKNLDEMSIEAIGAYISGLNLEIKRAEAAIKEKKSARESAHEFFKS